MPLQLYIKIKIIPKGIRKHYNGENEHLVHDVEKKYQLSMFATYIVNHVSPVFLDWVCTGSITSYYYQLDYSLTAV